MRSSERIKHAYIVSGDSSGGVPWNKLQLHVDSPKQILLLRLEAWPGDSIERKSKNVAGADDLTTATTPSDVEIIVEVSVAGGVNNQKELYTEYKE